MMKNPANPQGGEIPVDQFVKNKLEKEKQEATMEKILADNPVDHCQRFRDSAGF